jgi:hypothetical protein
MNNKSLTHRMKFSSFRTFKPSSSSLKMEKKSNLFKSLSNHTIIFQVMGLQYFSLEKAKNRNFLQIHKYNLGGVFILLAAMAAAVAYILLGHRRTDDNTFMPTLLMDDFLTVYVIVFISFSMIFSLVKTPKTRKIYLNFEKISKIFSKDLNINLDYERFGKQFRNVCWFVVSIIVILTVIALAIYIRHDIDGETVFYMTLLLIGNAFLETCFFWFIFYTMLVNFHLKHIQTFLIDFKEKLRKTSNSKIVLNETRITVVDYKNHFEVMMKLKEIYGIIFTSKKMIVDVCGLLNSFQITGVMCICVNSTYQTFLWYKNEVPTDEIIGRFLKLSMNLMR